MVPRALCSLAQLGGLCVSLAMISQQASAGWMYTTIYGGPEYSSTTGTGYRFPSRAPNPNPSVNESGIALGAASKYEAGNSKGTRAVRWDGTGILATELGNIGTSSTGATSARAYAINDAGIAVGSSTAYDNAVNKGQRAVRWDNSGTATELDHLGTSASGTSNVHAVAINNTGTAVGHAVKYIADTNVARAVRWEANETVATELGYIERDSALVNAYAEAMNNAGTVVGFVEFNIGGFHRGSRAVRWEAGGTAATQLDSLNSDPSSSSDTHANAINDAGTVVGYSEISINGPTIWGSARRAVRWDAGGTVVTELDYLGNDPVAETAEAVAINAGGMAIGFSNTGGTNPDGDFCAVRWEAGGTAATALGNLGVSSYGAADTRAFAINDAGIAVGYARKYDAQGQGSTLARRAVYWGLDNVAVELSSLIHPASGWSYLTYATDISNSGWVTGFGMYDPDGADGEAAYERLFLLNINDITTVPDLAGDFDKDGDVDGRDFLIWQRNPSVGNLADWHTNYGAPQLTAASQAIPEPNVLFGMLTIQGFLLLTRRKLTEF